MGLETVELVMEIEDEFGIGIPDSDAEQLQTLGDTYNYVTGMLADRQRPGFCPSAQAFYRLRRELMTTYGLFRGWIRPDATLGDLIPEGSGRYEWKEVARRCGFPVPRRQVLHPFAPRFPNQQMTIRQLVNGPGPASCVRANGSVDPQGVWDRLRAIVAEQTAVPIEKLDSHTHYINDLNLD